MAASKEQTQRPQVFRSAQEILDDIIKLYNTHKDDTATDPETSTLPVKTLSICNTIRETPDTIFTQDLQHNNTTYNNIVHFLLAIQLPYPNPAILSALNAIRAAAICKLVKHPISLKILLAFALTNHISGEGGVITILQTLDCKNVNNNPISPFAFRNITLNSPKHNNFLMYLLLPHKDNTLVKLLQDIFNYALEDKEKALSIKTLFNDSHPGHPTSTIGKVIADIIRTTPRLSKSFEREFKQRYEENPAFSDLLDLCLPSLLRPPSQLEQSQTETKKITTLSLTGIGH